MRLLFLATVSLTCFAQGVALRAQTPAAVTFREVLGRDVIVKVVREERTHFVRGFTIMTKMVPIVAPAFDESIADRVALVEVIAPTPAAAEATLRVRFRLFLSNLTAYLLATTQKVTLDATAVTGYLDASAAAGKCGEIPCQSGCADKKPCDLRCNACAK